MALLGALGLSHGAADATTPPPSLPDTPLAQAAASCFDIDPVEADVFQLDVDVVLDTAVLDGGHGLALDVVLWSERTACVVAALGLPEWTAHHFPGWVTIDDYTLTWAADDDGVAELLVLDDEAAPDATS
jgi:hypothetical protein